MDEESADNRHNEPLSIDQQYLQMMQNHRNANQQLQSVVPEVNDAAIEEFNRNELQFLNMGPPVTSVPAVEDMTTQSN